MMRSSGLSRLLFCCLLLGGCAGMDGIEPQATMTQPDALPLGKEISEAISPANSRKIEPFKVSWPDETWWHTYRDPQLNALVERAVRDNPDIKVARHRIEQAQAQVGRIASGTWPQLDANARFGREHYSRHQFYPPPYAGSGTWTNNFRLDFSYEIDLWGKTEAELRASLSDVAVGTAEARVAQLSLQTAVVRTYVELSLQYSLKAITAEALRQRREILAIARKRMGADIGTELDVHQAEIPLYEATARMENLDRRIALLRHQLAALTGQGPGAGDAIAVPSLSLQAHPALPATLPADLLGRRPDLVAHRWRIEAMLGKIDAAKAAFYPNINLIAGIGLQSVDLDYWFSSGSLTHGIGPAITLPIFDGGRLRANLGAQTATYDIAVENYNQALIKALQSVADQIATLRTLTREEAQTTRALDAARRAFEIAEKGYRAGIVEYINVLSVENALFAQQERRAEIRAARLEAYALLMQALGGGFGS